jgi:PAS domain S-box-containing protein
MGKPSAQIKKPTNRERIRPGEPITDDAKFKQFFENAPDYCYMVSPDGSIINVNKSALKALGYRKKELIGKPLETIYAPEVLPKMKELFTNWKDTGRLINEEMTVLTKNGKRRDVLLSADMVKGKGGRVLHSVSIQKDITQRKQIEEELKQHKSQLDKLVEERTSQLKSINRKLKSEIQKHKQADEAVRRSEATLAEAQRIARLGNWDWDILINNLSWSDEIYRIFGLNLKESVPTYDLFLNSVHPDDRDFVKDSVNKALYQNEPYSIDHRIVLPDGTGRIVHEEAEIYRNHTGQAIRMIGTVLDITEQKENEYKINRINDLLSLFIKVSSRKEFLHSIVELVRNWSGCHYVGIRMLNKKGEVPYETSIGFSRDFLKSECWLSIKEHSCACTRVVAKKSVPQDAPCMTEFGSFYCNDTAKFMNKLSKQDKKLFRGVCTTAGFASIAVIPYSFQAGVRGAIHLADKGRGKVPLKLIEDIESLTPLIGETIHRIEVEKQKVELEKQLRQAQQLKLLGQLASGVAHEVRNPLNAIIAISEALFQDIGENPEYTPYLEHIRNQVDRLSQLMKDLLDLGRPIQQSDMTVVSLASVCSSAVELWKQTHSESRPKINMTKISNTVKMKVMADNSKLQQVFINLLDNASHHSPEQSEIRIRMLKPDRDAYRIQITDQGSGFNPEYINRAFEPFFTTRKQGTGLGLSIVKHIVEIHGGNIKVWNNEPPPGSTVEIQLPVIEGTETKGQS